LVIPGNLKVILKVGCYAIFKGSIERWEVFSKRHDAAFRVKVTFEAVWDEKTIANFPVSTGFIVVRFI